MEKTNLIKAMLILVIGVILISVNTNVLAADDGDYTELTLNNTSVNNTNTNQTNTNTNKANTNTNVNNTNKTNSTIYNNTNTNLPKTGIEDTIPVALLVTVFGISALYAYKKINDYKNI